MKQSIPDGSMVAVDTETTGLNRWRGDRPFIFSFCSEAGEKGFIEFEVNPYTRRPNYLSNPSGCKLLRKFFSNRTISKVFHNLKFDVGMSNAAGFEVLGTLYENTLAAHNCNSQERNYKLKDLSVKYADYPKDDETDLQKAVVKLRRKSKPFGIRICEGKDGVKADYWLTQYADQLLSVEEAASVRWLAVTYAMCDAERTMLLWLMYLEQMERMQVRPSFDFEMTVIEVIRKMENVGAYINPAMIDQALDTCQQHIARNLATIVKEGGPNFNPGSGPQKIKYFIEEKGFKPLALTEKDRLPQIDKDFLESIESRSPMARAILEHSRAVKAKSTYLENYRILMDEDARIHPSFKMQTATGRLSCTDPNLQNVPVRVPKDSAMYLVRQPFSPAPGCIWYLGDYAQIEARIFADEADEEDMMEACRGSDVYTDLVKIIQRVAGLNITRQQAKTIFLGKIYGLGKRKLMSQLGCEEVKASNLIYEFDGMFPRAKAYMKETIREIYENGYVWTRYGKRLGVDQAFAYKGVNYKIQGNAAGLMKRAMVRCSEFLDELGYGKMILSIHDELIFEFPLDKRPKSVLRKLRSIMEDNEGVYRVPTPVDFKKATDSWTNKQPVSW
jgi:DNA polymerase I-like protein with 3'-5' exonuclease and polymerase domains